MDAEWKKAPPELVAVFEDLVPAPPAEARQMFGYPAAFVNGNMFMGVFQDRMFLRLPDEARGELMQEGGDVFDPMGGRPMKEYAVVPQAMLSDRPALEAWVKRSLEYGLSLPPKAPRAKRSRKA